MKDRYLSLMKSILLNEIYVEQEVERFHLIDCVNGAKKFDFKAFFSGKCVEEAALAELAACKNGGHHFADRLRYVTAAATMIGRMRLDNIESCLNAVLRDGVPGAFVECGVWRGGACAFAKALLIANGEMEREVWLADSFAGLPKPAMAQDNVDLSTELYPMLAVPEHRVRSLFERLDLLDDKVRFLPGFFDKTLPDAPIGDIAVLRLDGDYYESTMIALDSLYDKVPRGGFVIIDDYGPLEPCRRATDEFREKRGIDSPLVKIDDAGYFWRVN